MDKRENKLVSIVVSAYNEEECIGELYERLSDAIQNSLHLYEFVFVNDGSTDQTLPILCGIMEKDNRVRIVNLVSNKGHEIAMTAGMDYAQGDCVLFMDADLQHPPSIVPNLIKAWDEGHDLVLTKRTKNYDQSLYQKISTKLFYKVLNFLSDSPIPEQAPDFRLIDRKYVKILKKMRETSRLFRGMISWLRVPNSVTIEFEAPSRFAGATKYSLTKLILLAIDSIVSFSIKPLRLATYFGILTSLVSLLLGIIIIIDFLTSKTYNHTGFGTVAVMVIFIGSIQLIVLGIIGEYLGRIHLEVKNRPLYIAEYYKKDDTSE